MRFFQQNCFQNGVIDINNDETLYLVDSNGEIVNEIDQSTSRVVIQSIEKIKKGGTSLSKAINSKRLKYRFAKLNMANIKDIKRVAPFFIDLIPYISYFDNILRFDNGVKINPMNIGLIYGEKNTSRQYGNRLVKQLVDNDIVHKYGVGKNSYLVVNPWICYCGKTIQADVAQEFEESKWKRGDY